jgi:PEP-CTERM motif
VDRWTWTITLPEEPDIRARCRLSFPDCRELDMHRLPNWTAAIALALALCAGSAEAGSVTYEFSLPANGEVGPITVELTVPDFLDPGGTETITSYSSSIPIDTADSAFLIFVNGSTTMVGFNSLLDTSGDIIYDSTRNGLFTFTRTPDELGVMTATGTLASNSAYDLDTLTFTGTLTVTTVPEPSALILAGAAALGCLGVRARRRRVRA